MVVKDLDGRELYDIDVDPWPERFDLRRADFAGQQIGVLDLSDADLRRADFSRADLYWTMLYRADCEGAVFTDARLAGVDLKLTNLKDCLFRGAYVSYDNLQCGCSLQGANLTGADLTEVDFRGSQYDISTLFPEGFSPTESGMVFTEGNVVSQQDRAD